MDTHYWLEVQFRPHHGAHRPRLGGLSGRQGTNDRRKTCPQWRAGEILVEATEGISKSSWASERHPAVTIGVEAIQIARRSARAPDLLTKPLPIKRIQERYKLVGVGYEENSTTGGIME